MPEQIAKVDTPRTGHKAGIWFAWFIAFGIHVAILFLPNDEQPVITEDDSSYLEVQLTESIRSPEKLPEHVPEPELLPDPEPEIVVPIPEPLTEPESAVAATETEPTKPQPVVAPEKPAKIDRQSYDSLTSAEKTRLTNTILSAQFITEASVTEQIFGRQMVIETGDPQPGFHIPMRQSMMTMLDQPMQDLPFAYTPGLVHFAYDPGVKGDLQRFWDVITPEFGWRTKNGTEFKCVWVLILAGCGWK